MVGRDLLLVEDNPADVRLAAELLRPGGTRLHVVADGTEALAFLRRLGPWAGAPRPDLVLLDLNLPRRHGLEILQEIKADPTLVGIPIVVLTTSDSAADVERCYASGAAAYVVKPLGLAEFREVIRAIESFWLRRVTFRPDGRFGRSTAEAE
jgi:CheY-like chemotaxis protein